jgi:hypothetical protein
MIKKEDLEILTEDIMEECGIELEWYEKAAFSLYAEAFIEKEHSSTTNRGVYDFSLTYRELKVAFMKDYFGLDYLSLHREKIWFGDSLVVGVDQWDVGKINRLYKYSEIGADMIGTPEFKEYCRRHVNEWRAERDRF